MPLGKNKTFGNLGEDLAVSILTSSGYKIVERNFKSKFGELDIVAIDKDTLVFAEVKARTNSKFGYPEEAVNARKLYHIKKTGEYYSLTHPTLPKKLRIDVVSLVVNGETLISSKIIQVE